MGNFVEDFSGETKTLILSSTNALLNSFDSNSSKYYRPYFLFPAFLFLSIVGIRKRNASSIVLSVLLVPTITSIFSNLAKYLHSIIGQKTLKCIINKTIGILDKAEKNVPITISLLLALTLITSIYFKRTNICFYIFIGILYYTAVFSIHASKAYFSITAFTSALLAMSFILLLFISETLHKLVTAILFGFSGIWGLQYLLMDYLGKDNTNTPSLILDDIFGLNLLDMSISTCLFLMYLALSLFAQYSLESLKKSTEIRGRVIEKEKFIKHQRNHIKN